MLLVFFVFFKRGVDLRRVSLKRGRLYVLVGKNTTLAFTYTITQSQFMLNGVR